MAQFARSGSAWLAALLAVAILMLFGYILFTDGESISKKEIVDPPIELAEPDLPLETIEVDDNLPSQQEIRENEADAFVDNLAPEQQEATTINEHQDQFIRPDGLIALPQLEERVTTLKKLMADKSLDDDTPLTLNYVEETREQTTIADIGKREEDHIAPVTIITESGETITAPLNVLLNRDDIDQPVTELRTENLQRELTAGELETLAIDDEQEIHVTINRGTQEFAVRDILGADVITDDSLLYLHRVTDADRQGLWGIIHAGLIEKFRQGMRIEGVGRQSNVSAIIPADADEPLPDGFSSFLGKILDNKVTTSYVYNFKTNVMGRDPNLIYPGQQLIMIQFSPDELREIYLFFAEQRGDDVKTFAIGS
ncbi:hypothetical protein [Methylophaga sp. OBS3]|uniref:hypothetical protein n=1 Tax=Methylophaga sp. OBS3 TaxID=2991934 RepID=UPI00225AC70A|nr:hypothetical protein [Methylophaga sp. OBS3]MCX4190450.1 hypothetical protein [Methylophaga sp. OBS3]